MLFQILWTTSFYIKLYFLLFYIFCWTAFSDKLHFLTNYIFWQTTFSDKLGFLLNCIFWQTAFSDKLHFLTNCIFCCVTAEKNGNQYRMLSRITSYPFLSQTLSVLPSISLLAFAFLQETTWRANIPFLRL
jgi:hypothetical protein